MLTSQDVISAYQLLLGRQPESEATIQNYVAHASFEQLRERIIGSAEFASRIVAQPKILNVDPCVLGTSAAVRLASRQLEHLATLRLSVWGKTVLCTHLGPGNVSTFFIDRHCKLSVCESDPDLREEKRRILRELNRSGTIGNLDICALDLDDMLEFEQDQRWQVVVNLDSDVPPRDVWRRMKNLAGVCSDTLIVDAKVAFGDADQLFVTRVLSNGGAREIATPTRRWFMERLAKELPYVYTPRTQPCHEDYPLAWRASGQRGALGRCIFVASRAPLDESRFSSVLLDEQTMQD